MDSGLGICNRTHTRLKTCTDAQVNNALRPGVVKAGSSLIILVAASMQQLEENQAFLNLLYHFSVFIFKC